MRQPPSFNANWQSEDYPMVNVTWEDARAYCEWAGGRLPTEAEWEYAARAGTDTVYYWGNSLDGDYAWYSENSGKQTHPVGKKRANGWGLYDMVGNVWEWCSDWWGAYPNKAVINPTGSEKDSERVIRGGSLEDHASECRSASRSACRPESHGGAINHIYAIGFRCVCNLLNKE